MLFLVKSIYHRVHVGTQFVGSASHSLVLQVLLEPVWKRKVGKKVESIPANAASDALTTQLAQQARSSCGNKRSTELQIIRRIIQE